MIFGALAGIAVLYFSGSMKVSQADEVITGGMKMMAIIGFVMITASGFAAVINATGDVEELVKQSAVLINGNQSQAAFMMLIVIF